MFIQVDATVLEVGVGGTYDCTNLVPKPLVTGITSLGLDHTAVLGKTLTDIAWHKGGIFKVSFARNIVRLVLIDYRKASRRSLCLNQKKA